MEIALYVLTLLVGVFIGVSISAYALIVLVMREDRIINEKREQRMLERDGVLDYKDLADQRIMTLEK